MAHGVTTLPAGGVTAKAVYARVQNFTRQMLAGVDGVGANLVGIFDTANYFTGTTVEAALAELGLTKAGVAAFTDPGNAGAIPVTRSGCVPIVTAGAETRTLAVPTFINQRLTIYFQTKVGNCVITSSQAINVAGNTTITLTAVGQTTQLVAAYNGTALRWRVLENDGPTLG